VAANKGVTDEEVIIALKRFGSPKQAAQYLGLSERSVYLRRNTIQQKTGEELPSFNAPQHAAIAKTMIPDNRRVLQHNIGDGVILVGSDAHYWPGEASVAHKAFVAAAKMLKPDAIVLNGDVLDGARISRHEPLYNTNPPSVKQEIEACQERLGEIEKASKNSTLFWTYGNHDVRLWRYIRINAPELEGLPSMDLFDHFPGWHHGWRVDINDSVVIKHRYASGVHAAYNNTVKSGRSVLTGHLHRLCVTPWGDYNGRRWGVDTGTLADPSGDQFTYMEENPTSGCSGFAVLTFKDGKLLPPELCEVLDGVAYFRGKEL
jgi:predicted phosphodiesterase